MDPIDNVGEAESVCVDGVMYHRFIGVEFNRLTPNEVTVNGVTYIRKYKFKVDEVAFLGTAEMSGKALRVLPIDTLYCYTNSEHVFRKEGDIYGVVVGTKADIEGYNG